MVLDHYRFGRIRSRVRAVRVCQNLTKLESIYSSQFGSESDESEIRGAGGWLIPAALNPVVPGSLQTFFLKVFLSFLCYLNDTLMQSFAAWLFLPLCCSFLLLPGSQPLGCALVKKMAGTPSSAAWSESIPTRPRRFCPRAAFTFAATGNRTWNLPSTLHCPSH